MLQMVKAYWLPGIDREGIALNKFFSAVTCRLDSKIVTLPLVSACHWTTLIDNCVHRLIVTSLSRIYTASNIYTML